MRTPFAPERVRSIRPEINVTPLVDIVLVLLIIFMVVLPSMQDEGRPIEMVELAEEESGGEEPNRTAPQVVTVTAEGKIFVGEAPVSETELEAALASGRSRNPAAPVLLRGDRRAPYRTVREVLSRVRNSGASNIRLAVGVHRSWNPVDRFEGDGRGATDR